MFFLKRNRRAPSMHIKLVVKHIGDKYVVAHSYALYEPGGHREVTLMRSQLDAEYEHITDPDMKAIWFKGLQEVKAT